MAKKVELIQEDQQLENRVYELGFHFIPTIAEDEVAVQFSHLKSLIEKRGGQFIAEEMPKFKNLAYPISTTNKGQKKNHLASYFGWVKFEINPEEVIALEKEIKAFATMLRFLLIKTVKENTFLGAVAEIKADSSRAVKAADEVAESVISEEVATAVEASDATSNEAIAEAVAEEVIDTEKVGDIATE
ncbi:MAG: 30S ribosomal protein S6 [bacterium]